jgi:hypothetical protein
MLTEEDWVCFDNEMKVFTHDTVPKIQKQCRSLNPTCTGCWKSAYDAIFYETTMSDVGVTKLAAMKGSLQLRDTVRSSFKFRCVLD